LLKKESSEKMSNPLLMKQFVKKEIEKV
jgi:hypothetical protein